MTMYPDNAPYILKFHRDEVGLKLPPIEIVHRIDDMQAEVRIGGQVLHLESCYFGPLSRALRECERRQKENE